MVAIVTGGGRGIGAATVLNLAAAGPDVVVDYRQDRGAPSPDPTGAVLRIAGGR